MSQPPHSTTATGWRAIRADMLARLAAREWQPGARIPDEADLAAHYGCARATANRALRALAEAGLLERRRKAGTYVAETPVRQARLQIPLIRVEVEASGARYAHQVLQMDTAPAPNPVCARLGLPQGTVMLHLRALHLANDRPHALEDRWVSLEMAPGLAQADLAAISANEWLVRNAPFTRGEIAFAARAASPLDAHALACAPGDALFVVERSTWAGTSPVTTVTLLHPPGYHMQTQL